MTATQANSIVRTSDSASSHEDWLCVMRGGMATLLGEPRLLTELIWGEASRQVARRQSRVRASRGTSAEAIKIFDELGQKSRAWR
ncbi:MAG: hypothetical protein EOO38_19840 [Cytophagaceae bacterium]|nr:MAG: hypothetical protein EOO38_19840 [Cytophagaceae bacterium]